ncbi:uncharacterized protein LOC124644158 [Helicoverpa zea]|uniref:uncharacterized protein LOC124644158 n=1 Tax=Helicoverpa zea TaxID=7113 RepID=UPI001F570227|nr:uncharacterized protein LOC124644158 [Helicoverpa zea]
MVSVTSIVVIVCAFALGARGQNACSPAEIGSPTGYPVQLQELILKPYVREWTVNIPAIPQCVNGVSGALAEVCDGDVPPQSQFISIDKLLIRRVGSVLTPATVTVTVFCVV